MRVVSYFSLSLFWVLHMSNYVASLSNCSNKLATFERGGSALIKHFQNVFISNCQIYLSQIAKYILLRLENVFCLKSQNVFVLNSRIYLSQMLNGFVSNCKMYLSQIAKWICLILTNDVLVLYWQMYLCNVQNVFVQKSKMYLSQVAIFLFLN